MNLIFVGNGEFGGPVLEALAHDNRFTIPFVITGLDKKAGRKLKIIYSRIKEIALKNKLIVHQSLTTTDLKQKLMQAKPDFLLVVSFGEIIKKEIFDIPKHGAINIHPSLLPKYRGSSPVQETLLHDDSETGVTWIRMTAKMDEGPIIAQKKISIADGDNFVTLTKKLQKIATEETGNYLKQFASTHVEIPQNDIQATYCKKINKSDGALDPSKETAEQMLRKIKAYVAWPGCFILWQGKRLKIIQATVSEQKISSGQIEILNKKILAIGTKKGTLLPVRVKPESKREMSVSEFLCGIR